jgi:hypothetical protein
MALLAALLAVAEVALAAQEALGLWLQIMQTVAQVGHTVAVVVAQTHQQVMVVRTMAV